MADVVYNRGKFRFANTGVASLAVRATVITGTAVGADALTLNTVADLDAVASVNIHTERLTPASVVATEDDANNRVNIDCANLTFAAAPGVTAVGVVFYHEAAAADASRELLTIHTTGFPQPMDGGLNVTVNDFARLG